MPRPIRLLARGNLRAYRPAKFQVHLVGYPIKDLATFAAPSQHSGFVHYSQMPRRIGLGDAGLGDNIGNTFFLAANRVQYSQSSRLAQHAKIARNNFKNLVQLIHFDYSRIVCVYDHMTNNTYVKGLSILRCSIRAQALAN